MNDPIASSATTPSPSIGSYDGSISPEIATHQPSTSPRQVIKGASLVLDEQVPDSIQESYNNSYAVLSDPESQSSSDNLTLLSAELRPINQQITQFIASTASAETSSDILDAIQVSLEQEEEIYEQHYAPGAPDPAVNNATVINEQENTRLVSQSVIGFSSMALSSEDSLHKSLSLLLGAIPGGVSRPARQPNPLAVGELQVGKGNEVLVASLAKQQKFATLLSEIMNYSAKEYIKQYEVDNIRESQQEEHLKAGELGAIKAKDTLTNRRPSVHTDIEPDHSVDVGPNIGSGIAPILGPNIGPDIGPDIGPNIARKILIKNTHSEETPEEESLQPTNSTTLYNQIKTQNDLLRAMQSIANLNILNALRSSNINFQRSAIDVNDSRFSSKGVDQGEGSQNTNSLYLERALRKSVSTLNELSAELPAIPINASQ